MNDAWAMLDTIPNDGFYAVVVTAHSALVPVASGYAKSVAQSLHERYEGRVLIGLRLSQDGSGTTDEITDGELVVLENWVAGIGRPRRSGNESQARAVVYVERFDRIPEKAVILLNDARTNGAHVILVAAVDVAGAPMNESLTPFDTLRVINLPANEEEATSTLEVDLRRD